MGVGVGLWVAVGRGVRVAVGKGVAVGCGVGVGCGVAVGTLVVVGRGVAEGGVVGRTSGVAVGTSARICRARCSIMRFSSSSEGPQARNDMIAAIAADVRRAFTFTESILLLTSCESAA